jgi:hypothetical protein
MPVMAVNNQNPHEPTGDDRSWPRWSAGKKTDAVLRLLRGEPLEALSRALEMEALWQPAEGHWRAVNGPYLVALVRAGARFQAGKLVERAQPGHHHEAAA